MKNIAHARSVFTVMLAALSMAACGGGGSGDSGAGAKEGTQASGQAQAGSGASLASPVEIVDSQGDKTSGVGLERKYRESGYARVVRVAPSDLGMTDGDMDVSKIRVLEGQDLVEDLVAQGGEIRFITPADPGQTRMIRMRADVPGVRKELKIELVSPRFLGVADITEFDEAEGTQESVPLLVKGLGADNSIGTGDLVFEVPGSIKIHPVASNALLDVDGRGTIALRGLWTPLESGRGFVLSHEALKDVIQRLPEGDISLSVTINGAGKDSAFSRQWAFVAHVPVARMEGRIIDTKTKEPIRGLAGRKVGITGMGTNGTRAVAVVDGEGRFSTDGLSAGNYMVELLDTRVTGFTKAAFTVKRDDTNVQVELPYVASVYALAKARRTSAVPKDLSGTDVLDASNAKVSVIAGVEGKNCVNVTQGSNADFGFNVMASPADASLGFNSCTATLRIPQGVSSVGLSARVFGYRYVQRMENNSKDLDDIWFYRVFNLPREIWGLGSSTDGYSKGGMAFNEGCVDVRDLTKNGPHDFSINILASNTGQRDAYAVGFWVESGCKVDLQISKAEFGLENIKGHRVIRPIKSSPEGRPNYSGAYISLPSAGDPSAWGVPVELDYRPKDAVIDEVKLIMVGGFGEREVDIKGQAVIDGKGGIVFKDLSIPENLVPPPFGGEVQFFVALRGRVEGVDQTSQRFPIKVSGDVQDVNFIPLFNAGGVFGENRRYGQGYPDVGGDSWATWRTLNWLRARDYRFNDISAQHVAQKSEDNGRGRSILGHSGHSDGEQLDLRYSDGEGGYGDKMGGSEHGAYIRQALDSAEKDVYQNRLSSSSNLTKIVNWILENRKMIEREAGGARVVYAGNDWMQTALLDGKFASGKSIPYSGDGSANGVLSDWKDIPKNVKFVPHHRHHWHISLVR